MTDLTEVVKEVKWQLVWWWRWPTFKMWQYPPKDRHWYYDSIKKPIFYGLYLGVCEIRYFPKAARIAERTKEVRT